MKKLTLILTGMVLMLVLLGAAGFAYAQADNPEATGTPQVPPRAFWPGGILTQGGWFGRGMGEDGILGDYFLPAFVDAFGLQQNQAEAFQVSRETLQGIRAEFSADEIQKNMEAAFSSALEAALQDGAITQEQADLMLDHMAQRKERVPFTPGGRGMRSGDPGMMGIHSYVEAALAEALAISVDELQAMQADGNFNILDFDLDAEQMVEVYTNAIQAALREGVITQEQADFMLERLEDSGCRLPFNPGGRGWRGFRRKGQ